MSTNDPNRYAGPRDGDYASYVEQLGGPGGGRETSDAGRRPAAEPQAGQPRATSAATGAPGAHAAYGKPQAPGRPSPGARRPRPDDTGTNRAGAAGSAPAPSSVSPMQQEAAPASRAPRRIGLLLIIAAWLLFFVALRLGIQAWHARSGHIDDWLPAGFALIAARLLLAMGKAARNPRVRPRDPAKSFPEHIDY